MIRTILADGAAGAMIPGEWITFFVVSIITAIGGAFAAYKKGLASATSTRLEEPVPIIRTKRVSEPPTWDQHMELHHRVSALEHTTQELRRELACQFRELLQAGGEREMRITDKLDGIARAIHARIDDQLKSCSARQCPTTRK